MKILIISYFYPPLNSIASLRAYGLAKSFAAMGHDVSVLTAAKQPAAHDLKLHDDRVELIEARSALLDRLFGWLGVNSGTSARTTEASILTRLYQALNQFRIRRGLLVLGRLPDLFDLLTGPSRRAVRGRTFDLVISSYAPRYCHAVGYALKRENPKTYWIADYRDLWTRHHQFRGVWPFTLLERVLEKRYLRNADRAATVTPQLAAELAEYLPSPQVLVVPNGYDQNDLDALPSQRAFDDEKKRWLYSGTIYSGWHGFEIFLQALTRLKAALPDLSTHIEVIFAGADTAGLAKRCETLGLADIVRFPGLLPRTQVLCMQRDADALLFFDPDEGTGIATGKLYEYLSSGTPIWRIGPPEPTFAAELVNETRTGFDIGFCEARLQAHFHTFLDGDLAPIRPDTELIRKYERSNIARSFLEQLPV